MEIKIDKKLYNDIVYFCDANEIKNVELLINKMLKKQFNIELYGDKPDLFNKPKQNKTIVNSYTIVIEPSRDEKYVEKSEDFIFFNENKSVSLSEDKDYHDNIGLKVDKSPKTTKRKIK